MSQMLVFGHKNPDTDTIASAITLAYLLNERGEKAEAVALGDVNDETAYALSYFGLEAPRIITKVATETDRVALVDHNEAQQSVDDLSEVSVKIVIDHHRIANFETADPLYYRAEPLGATATILYKLFRELEIAIPKYIAGMMLSAIISDTLLLKSPTCTELDIQTAHSLATIAEVDLNIYGLDMLKAGTNVDGRTPKEIINDDAKTFEMGYATVRIGQVNVVDVDDVLSRKGELLQAIDQEIKDSSYNLFILLITNILESDTVALIHGETIREVERAFDGIVDQNIINLPGVVSRKKQVVPPLTEAFTKE